MADKCLRNASCKCTLCAGFDVASLMSISKSISSKIKYENSGDDATGHETTTLLPCVASSPSVPSQIKPMVATSPALARPPTAPELVANFRLPTVPDDVDMADTDALQSPLIERDTPMESVAPIPSNAKGAVPSGPGSTISMDLIQPKLTDKNWKVRKEGFEALKTLFEQAGTRIDHVCVAHEVFPAMCDDSNASAMEAGLAAVLAYIQQSQAPLDKEMVTRVMARVIDKGFSARLGTVKLGTALTDAFIAAGAAEATVLALLEGTTHRKPRVPPVCATCILDALTAYGPRVVPLQAIKAALPKLMEGAATVRPIAMRVMVELYRWTGPALLQDIVPQLRQAQQTEFDDQTKDIVPGQATPTKFIRHATPSDAASDLSTRPVSSRACSAVESTPAFDPREFVETVDLLAKLSKSDFKTKLALPKWSEKVAALAIVLELIGPVPKLATGDYYELVSTLKALTNDANVNIVAKSMDVLGALADGLRKQFTPYARMMFPELLRKLSDKKAVILCATNRVLDLFLQHAMPMEMMIDELKQACDATKNKAPPARVQTMAFVARAVEKHHVDLNDKTLILSFGAMFMKGIEDTDPKVREAGQKDLITLVQATDHTAGWLQTMMDDIARKNPRAFKTIQRGLGDNAALTVSSCPSSRPESASSSRPPSRPGSAGSAASRSTGGGSKAHQSDMDVDMDSTPTPAATRRPSLKKRGAPTRMGTKAGHASRAAKRPPVPGSGAAPSTSVGASTDFTPVAISLTTDDAEELIAALEFETWPSIQDGFASSKWIERKEAIEGLEAYAKANASMMSTRVIEAFTLYISKQVKAFKDNNINVLKSAFQAIGTFAESAAGKFPRSVVCLVLPRACDKLGDKKANPTIRTMMLHFCEVTSPSYTMGCMIESMPTIRLPLAHIEALSVLTDCVTDFGISTCNLCALTDYAKGPQGLEASNLKVRSAATLLLSTMYSQLGPALLPILNLESWKPALAKTVEEAFQKAGFDPENAMTTIKRKVKGQEEAPAAVNLGALVGRVDISSHITKELLDDMKNETDKVAWKKRAEALDRVQAICLSAGYAIELTRAVQEVLRHLKARLNDANANLKVKAATVIGVVASSVGPEIVKMSRILGASLIAGVADNKKTMQAAALQALNQWVRHNHQTSPACLESLLTSLSEGLMNPVGRAELLGWAVEHLQQCDKLDLNSLVAPAVQCMMDKSLEAREKAQVLLVEVMKSVGKDTVMTIGARDIKPAAMRALKPLLLKVCEVVAASKGSANAAVAAGSDAALPALAPAALATPGSGLNPMESSGTRRRAGSSVSGNTPVKSRLVRPASMRASLTLSRSKSATNVGPLLKMSTNKSARLAKGQFNKWTFEPTSVSEIQARKGEIEAEWKPFLSLELHAKLFAPSLDKGMLAAMDELTLCIIHQRDEVISVLDLVFKWCTLRMVDNNVQALAKLLEVLVKILEMLKSTGYQLADVEAAILLPYLLQESGQSKPRFRIRFRDVMKLVVDVYSPDRYVLYLMECLNKSKNMKSRCECIDLVEYIVTVVGYHVVGRKCIKEISKYVVAHEKELRESALSALVAVYTRMEGTTPDKFVRVAGLATQQGVDLLIARLKHLAANTVSNGAAASGNPAVVVAEREGSQPQRTGFGFGGIRSSIAGAAAAPATMMKYEPETQPIVDSAIMSGVQQLHSEPIDNDGDMSRPESDVDDDASHSAAIEELLLRPIERLINASKEIISAACPAYKEGGNALKGLYAITHRPTDPAEIAFLHSYVNEIVLALCDCIHGAFYAGNAEKRPEMYILAISITTLTVVFSSEAVTSMQRYTVERVLLELCSKIMDPRMEKFASHATLPASELDTLAPDEKRYLMVFKALYKAMRTLTERANPGDVYPSVINLLQRLVHNDVGEYNKNDTLKHLLKEDSLDQLVGRILLKLSTSQANALTPFEGIDIFGVLMQMHMFFSTLPGAEVMMVDIANHTMRSALKMMVESLMKTRSSALQASMKDIPPTSPVRRALDEMGVGPLSQQDAAEPTGVQTSRSTIGTSSSLASTAPRITNHFGSSGATNGVSVVPEESLTRRLFPRQDGGSVTRTGKTLSAFAGAARPGDTRGQSFTSFHAFAATRGSASTPNSRPSTTSAQLESLRERLQMSRHFN